MDYHLLKAKVNGYLLKHVGGAQRPAFFDVASVCPALDEITQAYPVIREECDRLLAQRPSLPRYHEIDPGQTKISVIANADRNWYVFMLYLLGYKPQANRVLCPETCRVLDRIPTLVQAFFSILDAGKSVPRHAGPYLGYLRYHLGLCIPPVKPLKLIVNAQEYVWKAGEVVMFDDSWPHEVINESPEPRVVLIVDVLRPLPLVPALLNKCIIYGLARPTYYRGVLRRVERSTFITTS